MRGPVCQSWKFTQLEQEILSAAVNENCGRGDAYELLSMAFPTTTETDVSSLGSSVVVTYASFVDSSVDRRS